MSALAMAALRAAARGVALAGAVLILELNLASVDTALRISRWGQ